MAAVTLRNISIGDGHPFALIAGPCVIESEAHVAEIAGQLVDITARAGVPFIFKASFDKANRTSGRSYRGPGLKEGLRVLAAVKGKNPEAWRSAAWARPRSLPTSAP